MAKENQGGTVVAEQATVPQNRDATPEEKSAKVRDCKTAARVILPFFETGPDRRTHILVRGLCSTWFKGIELTPDQKKKATTAFLEFSYKMENANEQIESFVEDVRTQITELMNSAATLDTRDVTLPGQRPAKDIAEAVLNYRPAAKLRNTELSDAIRIFAGVSKSE
jgi:hypothetical protein